MTDILLKFHLTGFSSIQITVVKGFFFALNFMIETSQILNLTSYNINMFSQKTCFLKCKIYNPPKTKVFWRTTNMTLILHFTCIHTAPEITFPLFLRLYPWIPEHQQLTLNYLPSTVEILAFPLVAYMERKSVVSLARQKVRLSNPCNGGHSAAPFQPLLRSQVGAGMGSLMQLQIKTTPQILYKFNTKTFLMWLRYDI